RSSSCTPRASADMSNLGMRLVVAISTFRDAASLEHTSRVGRSGVRGTQRLRISATNEGPLSGPSFWWWISRRSTLRSAQAAVSAVGCAGALAAAPAARVRPPPLERLRLLVARRPLPRAWVLGVQLADEEAALAAAAVSSVPARLEEPFGPAW